MTRTKENENVGKDMRSEITKCLTPGERTFYYCSKLNEGGEEAGGLGRGDTTLFFYKKVLFWRRS